MCKQLLCQGAFPREGNSSTPQAFQMLLLITLGIFAWWLCRWPSAPGQQVDAAANSIAAACETVHAGCTVPGQQRISNIPEATWLLKKSRLAGSFLDFLDQRGAALHDCL